MVPVKPENPKPSASYVTFLNHGSLLLTAVGFIFTILFVSQVFIFCFLYGKLEICENSLHATKTSTSDDLRFHLKQELLSYFNDKFENLPYTATHDWQRINPRKRRWIWRSKTTRYPIQKTLKISDPKATFDKTNLLPTGPPIKVFDAKNWLFSPPSQNVKQDGQDTVRLVKRSMSDALYRDAKEEPTGQLQGQLVDEATDRSWLKLNSYARIPYNTIQEFCSRTRASCPAGPEGKKGQMGDRGIMGPKGDRGDRGLPGKIGMIGEIGLPGEKGQRGPRGIKGDRGHPGKNGVDGRDGLPGEPGLDGIPGRHGMDGKDGKCTNGKDGMPGRNGKDGRDGRQGHKGSKGNPGITGQRGIMGSRGRPGSDGRKGDPGMPGVSAYRFNGTDSDKLLIAPTLAGTSDRKTITVRERGRLRLACLATGYPKPFVEWRRLDPYPITTGYWKDGTIEGSVLNISYVGREHTGTYLCEAYNGIGPNAKRVFNLKVDFEPYIRVVEWKVGSHLRESVTLLCHVEASPRAVTYWENQEARILQNSAKYIITYIEDPMRNWKSVMNLTILNVSRRDFGNYFCQARNELSTTRGVVKLHEIDQSKYPSVTGKVEGLSFGSEPPDYEVLFNESCDTSKCCQMKDGKTGSADLKYCIGVMKAGLKTKKNQDCLLTAVGKPVYQTKTGSGFGSWMRESKPGFQSDKYWRTLDQKKKVLFEYIDKSSFQSGNQPQNIKTVTYDLPVKFKGDSHVVYDGVFYYHSAEREEIVGYDLAKKKLRSGRIPIHSLQTNVSLYSSGRNFVDLNTDENGLWAIYGLHRTENTWVMKINVSNFQPEFTLNISLSHYKYGEMFITCGILYGIESASEKDTRISLALDLYREHVLDIELPFTNPVTKTTMLSYNPNMKMLYSWADGTQLTYPIKTEHENTKSVEA